MKPSGYIPILGATIKREQGGDFRNRMHCFTVNYDKTVYIIQGQSKLDMEEWIRDITEYQKSSLTSEDNFKKIKNAMKNDGK